MITKFKIFENNIFGSSQNRYWFLKGNESEIRHLLMKFYEDKDYIELKESIGDMVMYIFRNTKKYENLYGIFLFLIINDKTWNLTLKFHPIYNKDDKNKFINNKDTYAFGIRFSEYVYQGEIKLENDKFIVDTLDIDVEKYNL